VVPDFDEQGYLPPGLHRATLDEIAERFGREPELRQVEMESLRWLVDLARRAGVLRIVVNGSFVADVYEPNDVDCALLIGADYPTDAAADAELQQGLPFIQAEFLTQAAFDYYVQAVFGTDRRGVPKGGDRGTTMTLESKRELEVTRDKVRGLEQQYAATQAAPADNEYARELTLRSLRRTINQLKEEIARFEARTRSAVPGE